jgi:5,10-methylenetetrahydromethanopterin reductase
MAAVSEQRQPAGTGFAIREPLPWNDLAAIVRASEDAGYTAMFLPEISSRDVMVALGSLAGETRDLRLGSGIVPMRSRTPFLTAMAAATVQERSRGRHILGIGTGDARGGALEELRAYVTAVRAHLERGDAHREGSGRRLGLDPGARVPIWISALGPKALRLAGEIADGVLMNWCPPDRVAFARERVAEGADAAGRDPADITISVYIRSLVGEDADAEEAMLALKRATGEYASMPAYARQLEDVGLGVEVAAAQEAIASGRADLVPEALVEAVSAVGDAASERVEAYRAAGADLPVIYPVTTADVARSLESTLLALAPVRARDPV